MSMIDGYVQQFVSPFLQPGETVNGMGYAHNVVPVLARLNPIARSMYEAHFILIATSHRLLFCHCRTGVWMGGPKPEITRIEALPLASIAKVEPFNPGIIGHNALRITRHNGIVHEIMYAPSCNELAAHGLWVMSFPGWLAQGAASGALATLPRLEDPRIPMLSPPSQASAYMGLFLLGAIAFLAMSALLFAVSNGLSDPGPLLPILLVAGVSGYFAFRIQRRISARKRQAAQPDLPPGMMSNPGLQGSMASGAPTMQRG